ncbi:CYTH domain-containing protein [Breznakia blatticola]|nr:CYTH domain-containing protein [Breznakia blatticola]
MCIPFDEASQYLWYDIAMKTHIEKEYKILVTKEQFDQLITNYPEIDFITQTNYYYDNKNYEIMKQKGAMRIRESAGTNLFTLKEIKGDDLIEYEQMVDTVDASVFEDKQIQKVLNKYHLEGPFELVATLTTKRAMYVGDGYELCFDISTYGDVTDYEIEYEYTQAHDGLTNFNEILAKVGLTYTSNAPAKIVRALSNKGLDFLIQNLTLEVKKA